MASNGVPLFRPRLDWTPTPFFRKGDVVSGGVQTHSLATLVDGVLDLSLLLLDVCLYMHLDNGNVVANRSGLGFKAKHLGTLVGDLRFQCCNLVVAVRYLRQVIRIDGVRHRRFPVLSIKKIAPNGPHDASLGTGLGPQVLQFVLYTPELCKDGRLLQVLEFVPADLFLDNVVKVPHEIKRVALRTSFRYSKV